MMIKKLFRFSASLAIPLVLPVFPATAAEDTEERRVPGARATDISLRHEVQHAIDRGLRILQSEINEEGFWSDPQHPAITALAISAFLGDPSRPPGAGNPDFLDRAFAYLEGSVKRDGGIYVKGLANYNTSVSLMALLLGDRPRDHRIILNARKFLVNQQSDFDKKGEADNPFDGGIGYGGTYAHSDLSNTHLALGALYYSKELLADQPEEKRYELDWDAAITFVERCQNLPGHNDEEWASDDPANRGGFIYFPGDSKAGETTLENGKVALRSYGSMSYAGLLSYIYADLKRDDPRVKAALEWLEKNFDLEENPGMKKQGLYYYYHTMAKSLSIAGVDTLKAAGGGKVNWRRELALKLIDLQRANGHRVNESKRWWEGDPVLTTSYALLALERIHRGL